MKRLLAIGYFLLELLGRLERRCLEKRVWYEDESEAGHVRMMWAVWGDNSCKLGFGMQGTLNKLALFSSCHRLEVEDDSKNVCRENLPPRAKYSLSRYL